MTIQELKKIYQILKKTYAILDEESLESGVDITSPEYEHLKDEIREKILAKWGFTLEEYKQAKALAEQERLENKKKDNSKIEEVMSRVSQIKGEKGDTPIKGKDYWTNEDVDSMKMELLKIATPIKGVHYNDGKNGRNPLTVSKSAPLNPQIGDLWYKN
jgi:hypothetical protein